MAKGILDGSKNYVSGATTHNALSYYGLKYYKKVSRETIKLNKKIAPDIKNTDPIYAYGSHN